MYVPCSDPMSMTTETAQQQRLRILETEMRPILPLLREDGVQDILLNADASIWVDRAGAGLSKSEITMRPHEAEAMLKTIAAGAGKQIGPLTPSLAATTVVA